MNGGGSHSADRARCAVVVGGSRGIGRAVCTALAELVSNVAVIYRDNVEAAEGTARMIEEAGATPLLLRADVRDPGAIQASIERVHMQAGAIEILVHAAGGLSSWKSIRELTHQEWVDLIDIDLNGFFNVANSVLKIMHAQKRGSIVAISSIAARSCPPRSAQTAAAKAGLEAMIRIIAREEGKYGIRANAVSVGLTETDMGQDAIRHWGEAMTKRIIDQSALGRIGTPEEIARVVAFLASERAGYVTGRILSVDGGQFIGV
jgi:NAD(P)-dependent dehydrogenase (short-subunit alcohol dehydrogenase family)